MLDADCYQVMEGRRGGERDSIGVSGREREWENYRESKQKIFSN
jgi:hypothetical protein